MHALKIQQLKKTYNNGFEALKGIDLELAEGDFFALLGPNGAGKSTAIGIICSLINKTSGSLSVFGYDLDKQSSQVKQCLGVVPQEFNFNVFEPIVEILVNQAGYYGISRKIAYQRAEQLLKQLQLWDKRFGIARELSGGMKRRLMIARALMHQPRLLILDEPTAGVDIEIRRTMWAFLRELNQQGTTIILTTHYLEEAEQLCKRIAIIDEGSIIKNCSTKELLKEIESQCLTLELKDELHKAPELGELKCILSDPFTLEIQLKKHFSLNDIFQQLSNQQIEVMDIRHQSNRLEQLFFDLVTKNPKTDSTK